MKEDIYKMKVVCFLGASYNPVQSLSITGYVDFAYFPWPKYQISEASWAVEPFLSVKLQQKKWTYLIAL